MPEYTSKQASLPSATIDPKDPNLVIVTFGRGRVRTYHKDHDIGYQMDIDDELMGRLRTECMDRGILTFGQYVRASAATKTAITGTKQTVYVRGSR